MSDVAKAGRLAVIPARGGSKRVPRKNVVPFCGEPLMAHAIRAAVASSLFAAIHVSTDDDEIAAVAAAHGLRPAFPRPATLADDHATLADVLHFVTARFAEAGEAFASVTVLMPTAPLVRADDLVAAHALFDGAGGRRPVLAVTRFPVPVEWAFRRDSAGTLTPVQPGKDQLRSQDLAEAWYDAGAFAIHPAASLVPGAVAHPWLGHPLPRERAVDIDTMEDLAFAALLFRAQNGAA
ncbi:cytidylyltransferase domain-containing protein [Elioraea sp.]|uniref:acylneuraminate cytidylyltransferase family protein n=1 Tax=Elioraea sp. TaxID=2185103 RepID=UPI0025C1610D|nr:acylneuraminate cytidylyltransferase family protein [Elioraea sp.]